LPHLFQTYFCKKNYNGAITGTKVYYKILALLFDVGNNTYRTYIRLSRLFMDGVSRHCYQFCSRPEYYGQASEQRITPHSFKFLS
jgi:hypothetical protein